ncbi:MAG: hypothetical protein HY673_27075 [Chloroflexi bacterium]|nr:hypothetical protein [Chloroflexota bacterium]
MSTLLTRPLLALLAAITVMSCSPAPTPGPTPGPAPTVKVAPAPTQAPAQKPAATAAPATPAPKPAVKSETPFYQGKTIELTVDSSAGGGTDTVGRITAAHLPRFIPGNPRMIVLNRGGAAGTVGNNIWYEKAKPDGFALIQNGSSPISMQQRRREIVAFDLTKYEYVGSISRSSSIVMIRKGTRDRLTDTSAKPVFVGSTSGDETWQIIPMFGKELLGWNLRWLTGIGTSNELELAFRRGEVDVMGTSNAYVIRRLIQENVGEPLAYLGTVKDGKFTRRPDFPDVPTFEEVLGNRKPTAVQWQAYMAWMGSGLVDKTLAAPPRTPDNVMAILTDAFTKMSKDPRFDKVVRDTVSEAYDIVVGKEVQSLMKQIVDVSPEVLAYPQELQRKFGLVSK